MSTQTETVPIAEAEEITDQRKLKKIKIFTAVYPVFFGFSADLLFWVAIDTLFLTIVKGLDSAKIVFLTDFALIASIVLYLPITAIIKRLGNGLSVKIGVLFVLLSAVLLTFSTHYYLLLAGMTFKQIGYWFYEMNSVILKNNLKSIGRGGDFAEYQTKGYTIYSVFTAVIAFIASPLFNVNHYLPMFFCIACALISLVLSFFINDYSGEKAAIEEKRKKVHLNYKKLLAFILIYGLTSSLFASSQAEGKLFIQGEFFRFFSEKNVVFLIGVMVSISRIVRIISNIVSFKLYLKYKEKIFPILAALLLISMVVVTTASFIPISTVMVIAMILGYVIILFLRDPYKVFMYDFVLSVCGASEQKKVIMLFQFSNRIVYALILLSFSRILLSHTLLTVMYIFIVLAAIAFGFNVYAYLKGRKLHAERH